jgi:GMP synthase (glutamine-hydrolysing)
VHVLAVIHGDSVRAGTFGAVLEERGHELEEWSLAWGTPPPRPLDAYGAVLVLGGAMHADQDDHHPWLRDESFLLQRLLGLGTPLLGVCLGAQLIARASHGAVMPTSTPEIGWYPVELTEAAADDPLFSRLPERFHAFQWHFYTYELPGGACELARSDVCTQAFRLGERAWGIQFHAEVTGEQIKSWVEVDGHELLVPGDQLLAETEERLEEWVQLGGDLCGNFLEAAERVAAAA